jgi:hypothetical protein
MGQHSHPPQPEQPRLPNAPLEIKDEAKRRACVAILSWEVCAADTAGGERKEGLHAAVERVGDGDGAALEGEIGCVRRGGQGGRGGGLESK